MNMNMGEQMPFRKKLEPLYCIPFLYGSSRKSTMASTCCLL